MTVTFDIDSGTFHVESAGSGLSIREAYSTVETTFGSFSTRDSRYRRSCRIEEEIGLPGSASRFIVECIDSEKVLDLSLEFTLDDSGALDLRTTAVNRSGEPLSLTEILPLVSAADKGGVGFSDPLNLAISTEGYMFADQGTVTSFKQDPRLASWWSVLLFDPASLNSLLVGYLEHRNSEGILELTHSGENGHANRFSLTAHSTFIVEDWVREKGDWGTDTTKAWIDVPGLRPVTLQPGSSIDSDTLTIQLGSDPFQVFEGYADRVSRKNSVDFRLPVAVGWVSWDYYHFDVTEDDVLSNAAFIAENLSDSGMNTVLIDEGWQVHRGVWEPYLAQFPHGMKWLADRIREKGLRPGIWLAPYQVIETAPIVEEHPEWFLKNPDGSLKVCYEAVLPERSEESRRITAASGRKPALYGLDVTHPEARRWLHDLFQRLARDWGYEFFKIDFSYSSIMLSDGFYDPSATKAQAYRLALKTIREAVGKRSYVVDCGPLTSIGLVDAARINLDSAPTWSNLTMPQGQIRAVGRRYYMNGRFFHSHPDMLMVRPPLSSLDRSQAAVRREIKRQKSLRGYAQHGLTESQAKSIASLIALSGGQIISSDNLTILPKERLAILERILPVYGKSARPVDFFDRTYASIYHLKIEKPWENWDIVGLFNWDDTEKAVRSLDLQKIGLARDQDYIAFEFWSGRFLGTLQNALSLSLDPASCMILALHEKPQNPWILSTNRHWTQGGVDLVDLKWDAESRILSGTSQALVRFPYELTVYVPESFRIKKASLPSISCTVKQLGPNVFRIGVPSGREERFDWQIEFAEDRPRF